MKKYLLTALLGVFSLCTAFVSADSVVYTDGVPSPSSIYYVGNVICEPFIGEKYKCYIPINNVSANLSYSVDRVLLNGNTIIANGVGGGCGDSCSSMDIGIYETYEDVSDLIAGNFDYLLLEFGNVDAQIGTLTLSSDNFYTSLPSSDSSSSGTLLPNGTDDLKGIINGLESTMAEFIPYIAYIGLGIIVACIGFVAIRWLVNWVRAKIFDNF